MHELFIALLVFLLLCVAFIVIDEMHSRWAYRKALEEVRQIAEIEAQSAQPQRANSRSRKDSK